jgi:hypothetical protein
VLTFFCAADTLTIVLDLLDLRTGPARLATPCANMLGDTGGSLWARDSERLAGRLAPRTCRKVYDNADAFEKAN